MTENHTILVIEDDEIDAVAIKRALKDLHVRNPLVFCKNGAEGLEWVRKNLRALPGLILLDINMPVMNGLEFLDKIKHDAELRKIPVVILSTSKEESDRVKAFDLGVAGYMVKPVDAGKYLSVMKTISTYWQASEPPF